MSKTIYKILEETNPSYMEYIIVKYEYTYRDSILVKTDTIIQFKNP